MFVALYYRPKYSRGVIRSKFSFRLISKYKASSQTISIQRGIAPINGLVHRLIDRFSNIKENKNDGIGYAKNEIFVTPCSLCDFFPLQNLCYFWFSFFLYSINSTLGFYSLMALPGSLLFKQKLIGLPRQSLG